MSECVQGGAELIRIRQAVLRLSLLPKNVCVLLFFALY